MYKPDTLLKDVAYVQWIAHMTDKEWWDHIKNRPTMTQVLNCYGWEGEERKPSKALQQKIETKRRTVRHEDIKEPEYIRRRRLNKQLAKERQKIVQLVEERIPMRVTKKNERRQYALRRSSTKKPDKKDSGPKDNLSMALLEEELKKRKLKEEEKLKMKTFLFHFNSSVLRNEAKIENLPKEERTPLKVVFHQLEGKERERAFQDHLLQVKAEKKNWGKLKKELELKWQHERMKFGQVEDIENQLPSKSTKNPKKVNNKTVDFDTSFDCEDTLSQDSSEEKIHQPGLQSAFMIDKEDLVPLDQKNTKITIKTSDIKESSHEALLQKERMDEKRLKKKIIKERLEELREKRILELLKQEQQQDEEDIKNVIGYLGKTENAQSKQIKEELLAATSGVVYEASPQCLHDLALKVELESAGDDVPVGYDKCDDGYLDFTTLDGYADDEIGNLMDSTEKYVDYSALAVLGNEKTEGEPHEDSKYDIDFTMLADYTNADETDTLMNDAQGYFDGSTPAGGEKTVTDIGLQVAAESKECLDVAWQSWLAEEAADIDKIQQWLLSTELTN